MAPESLAHIEIQSVAAFCRFLFLQNIATEPHTAPSFFCGSVIATAFFCDIIATAPQRKNAVAQGWSIGPLTLFLKVPVLGLSVDFWMKGVAVLLKFILTRLLCSSLPGL